MLDLDGMKWINDTAGHLTGDLAFGDLGEALREATRSGDVVGRYGGDKFAIILTQTREIGAERVTQRLLVFLRDKPVAGPDGPDPHRGKRGLEYI